MHTILIGKPERIPLQPVTPRALFIPVLLAIWLWLPVAVPAQEASPERVEPRQQSPVGGEQKPKSEGSRGSGESAAPKTTGPEIPEQKPKLSAVAELKQQAQDAYLHARYAEAVAANLKIARSYPAARERRYAVQMLGTLYEDNVVAINNALKWDREFLRKYADPRQLPFYREKIAALEKMVSREQEQAFQIYQGIRFANLGDAALVKRFETLLQEHPDFLLKVAVERELGYAYLRMDKRKESYQAFQAVTRDAGKKATTADRIEAETTSRYWAMTATWAKLAWGVVAALWGFVLLMKPWQRVTRSTVRNFLLWAAGWALLTALRMPTFYAISTDADKIILHDSAVYLAAGLNLTVLLWIVLLAKGNFWQARPRALRWLSPILSLMMTAAVFFLFVVYQPNGPETTEVFAVKYDYLKGELRERLHVN